MSRHIVHTHSGDVPVRIEAGYDRALRVLYLQVWEDPERRPPFDQCLLFASHLDQNRNWSDIDSVVDVLNRLHIPVPTALYAGLLDDQGLHWGNRLTHHPAVSLATP